MTPLRSALFSAAASLAALAPFAGTPYRGVQAFDVTHLAGQVEREEDHITAIELARWIHDRKPRLRTIDLRSAEEYRLYHIAGSQRSTLQSVVTRGFAPDETIVLISAGGAHAAQGWVLLRARGYRNVFFLRGGIQEWLDDVVSPVIPPVVTVDTTERRQLSRYFGGLPRTGPAPQEVDTAAALRRRGC